MTAGDRRIQPGAAKLSPPRHDRAYLRADTTAALQHACSHRLTLVCAPAGYGKTTATAACLRQLELDFVWCRIDVLDRDPAVFVATLVGALRTRYAGFGQPILDRLLFFREAPLTTSELTRMLVEECSRIVASELLLVVDDYHEASDSAELNQIIDDLLTGAPDSLRFVILSRYDPAFPTGRLRVADQVATLGVDTLRFTTEQAAAALEMHTGRRHPLDHVERLTVLTEGWPASIVLAGLSHDRLDLDSLEHALGDPRMRLDVYTYLAEQVYGSETREMQRFLDCTCCLEHITAELSNTLVGIDDAHRYLDCLTRHRVFTFATDSGAYRYHNLFRDFLKHHYVREYGNSAMRDLQRRSAAALEAAGSIEMAVELLLTAHEPVAALDVIARAGDPGLDSYTTEALHSWLERLPWSMRITEPWPRLLAAQLHVRAGDLRAALTAAEAALAAGEMAGDAWATYHAYSALETVHFWRGDIDARLAACDAALPYASTEEQKLRTHLSVVSAAIESRDLRRAEAAMHGTSQLRSGVSANEIIRAQALRSLIALTAGDFREALALMPAPKGQRLAPDLAASILNILAIIHAGLGEYERALSQLHEAEQVVRRFGMAITQSMIDESTAVVLGALGQYDTALSLLRKAVLRQTELEADPRLILDTLLSSARILRRTGAVEPARDRAEDAHALAIEGLPPSAALSVAAERLFTMGVGSEDVGTSLAEVADAAHAAGLLFISLQARLFDAILAVPARPAHARDILRVCLPEQLRLGHIDLLAQELCPRPDVVAIALRALESPIDRQHFLDALAHHWDFAAVFNHLAVEAPDCLPDALTAASRHSTDAVLVAVLAAARRIPHMPCLSSAAEAAAQERGISQAAPSSGMDELTPREHQVLGLIARGLRNPQIASELFLSDATVKTHVNRIFFKLGVTSRVQAVLKYQEVTGSDKV